MATAEPIPPPRTVSARCSAASRTSSVGSGISRQSLYSRPSHEVLKTRQSSYSSPPHEALKKTFSFPACNPPDKISTRSKSLGKSQNEYVSSDQPRRMTETYVKCEIQGEFYGKEEGRVSSPGILRNPSDSKQRIPSRKISVSWSSIDDKIEFTDTESGVSDGVYSALPTAANRSKSVSNLATDKASQNHCSVPYFPPNQCTFSLPRPSTSNTEPHPIAPPRSSTLPRTIQTSLSDPSLPPPPPHMTYYKSHYKPGQHPYDRSSSLSSSIHEEVKLNSTSFDSDKYKLSLFPLPEPPLPDPPLPDPPLPGPPPRQPKGSGNKGKEKLAGTSDIYSAQVKQYLAALPEDKRPVNTVGVQWRIKQLQTQLPRYDHNINYCHEMSPGEQEEMFMFVDSRKDKAQGQGEVKSYKKKSKKKCEKCGGVVDCAVIADKIPGRVWHPSCFCCNTCDEILVDLIYFQYDGRLYCGRHHAELLRPRCHACDELIFGHEFITADKHEYHREHFCCWECDASLGGTKYVSHKGQPYCQGCFETLFCMKCVTCREPIGVGVPVYRHGPLRWHGNSQCYACSFCKTSLVNRTFMPTEKYVYCSKNCYRCHESLRKTNSGN